MTKRAHAVKPPTHEVRCADRIRVLKLAEAGDPPRPADELLHSIAAEIRDCCGHPPLKAYRLAYGWTVAGAVRALHATCEESGLGRSGLTKRSWLEWEAGKRPSRYNQDLLCRLFASGPVQLGFARDYRPGEATTVPEPRAAVDTRDSAMPADGRIDVSEGRTPPVTSGWEPTLPRGLSGHDVEWDVVMNAAHESSEHAAAFESSGVGPNTLEQLDEDMIRLARAYLHTPPLPVLGELVRVRNRTYWLLDRTRYPQQQRDLYLVAGQSCGLLASASFDLGYPRAAAQQARAARAYAEIIGHDELSAWSDGLLASIELWAGRPAEALRLAERGLAAAPDGTARVRLWCIAGRAAALLGDDQRATDAVAASRDARDRGATATELHDRIGGEFGFSPARQAFCNGSAYIRLGRADDALAECGYAVDLHAQAPPEERWYAAEAGARADLAAAHLLRGDLAGAREALGEVLTLRPDKRVEGVVQRLGAVRAMLAKPEFHNREGRALAEEIEQFTADTTIQALPSGQPD